MSRYYIDVQLCLKQHKEPPINLQAVVSEEKGLYVRLELQQIRKYKSPMMIVNWNSDRFHKKDDSLSPIREIFDKKTKHNEDRACYISIIILVGQRDSNKL
jgi:hypothetical protein